jgi:uncharacterized membrane protein YadS
VVTTTLHRVTGVCALFVLLFWPLAANAEMTHIHIPSRFVTSIFAAIACGNLLYQGYRIRSESRINIIAKFLLFIGCFLLGYEIYILLKLG